MVFSSPTYSFPRYVFSSCSLAIHLALLCTVNALVKLPPNMTIPAVFAFGDSIVDTGNNNYLHTLIKCDFPPYGIDFQGKLSTGRFCDGKVPVDILAEVLGIKGTVPAYLDLTLKPEDLMTGVAFASGGSGYDPLTPKLVSVLSLSDQLQYFWEYVGKLKMIAGEEKSNFIVANSIYLVVAGSDDIANTYFTLRARKQYDVPAYTTFMADCAYRFLQELYDMGARRMVVLSAPPIGCVPSQRTLSGGIARNCAEGHNQAAKLFNSKLNSRLQSLSSSLPDGRFVYVDVYNPLMDVLQNPNKYGFEVSLRGCCGTGNLEVAILCNQFTPPCGAPSSYVFWDSYHPTERAYRTLIEPVVSKYIGLLV
ncbi:hypothetical protein K2173_027761 [Erythroxylum novogranatense]|uniref:GDSL esterase/lipase EXL3 n=1 Tax=Erythroxylum novogranatense TaxID=1862640 RepID=A0AAV8U2X5_9ROSI|nr:hypothetical protein K2173_027761 [Erythroxylum novogranatense]